MKQATKLTLQINGDEQHIFDQDGQLIGRFELLSADENAGIVQVSDRVLKIRARKAANAKGVPVTIEYRQ